MLLMKLEVVVEVDAEMILMQLLLLKLSGGSVIGGGIAACIFTITNHFNTTQAI